MKNKIDKILKAAYPDATLGVSKNRLTGNYHVFVVSDAFPDGYDQENADALWHVLEKNLSSAQLIQITLALPISHRGYNDIMAMRQSR